MANEVNQKTGEIVPIKPSDLSVQLTDNAVKQLQVQRDQLRTFIKTQLIEGVDYGTIPGTQKPSLWKPGSEKIASIFKLGSRIVQKDRALDHDKNFAMFSYTVEIFHLPTGQPIAQCEGSANSKEKKYASRPMTDQLNTLQKMAQKRAYVGAVIIAVGASDYFTHDLAEEKEVEAVVGSTPDNGNPDKPFIFTFGKFSGRNIMEIPAADLVNYLDYLKNKIKDPSPMIKEAIEVIQMTLQEAQFPR